MDVWDGKSFVRDTDANRAPAGWDYAETIFQIQETQRAVNAGGADPQTAINTANIATNTADIATNIADIATNVTNIATNAADISNNTTNIATNVTNIATNVTNIATNVTDIATNVTNIATNVTDIGNNTTNITTNTNNILTNTNAIAAIREVTIGGVNGQVLTTDGSSYSWQDIDGLPAQAGHNGEFLTTDATTASWTAIRQVTAGGVSGQILTTDGSSYSWANGSDTLDTVCDRGSTTDQIITVGGVNTAGTIDLTASDSEFKLHDLILSYDSNNDKYFATATSPFRFAGSLEAAAGLASFGNIRVLSDVHGLRLGASDDYYINWNGNNATHVITAGAFEFDGGAIRLPTFTTTERNALSPVNGFMIYNSTANKVETYENGSWVTSGTDTLDLVCDRGATTDQFITTGGLTTTGMTTTQRDLLSPVNGMFIYNSTVDQFQMYENGGWQSWSAKIATNTGDIAALDLDDVCANSASTSYEIQPAGLKTTGHIHNFSDTSKHYFGAGDDYQIYYDGTDVQHYLVGGAGSFKFNNGAIGVPDLNTTQRDLWITSPYDGMFIFNVTSNCLQVYRNTSWQDVAIGSSGLPDQAGNAGEFLTTDGTDPAWTPIRQVTTGGVSGQVLTTDGTNYSWINTETELPSQATHAGEFLTTDGTDASWEAIRQVTTGGVSGQILVTDGSSYSWQDLSETDTLDSVCDRGQSTNKVITSGGVLTVGSIKNVADNSKHYFGAGDDYSIAWDGSNAIHTITAGAFEFDGGAIRLPTFTTTERNALSPVNGFMIYNSTTEKVERYENGAWAVEIITTTKYLYVKTTGNDTTGDGTSGNPWATIDKALDSVSNWVLLAPVNIYVERGSYTESTVLYFNHPDGGKISILGDYDTDTITLNSVTGSAGNWSIAFNVADTSKYTLNNYVIVHKTSGGTNPKNTLGVLKVTNIVTNTSVTLHSTSASAVMCSGAVTAYVSIPQVKWVRKLYSQTSFGGLYGIQVHYNATTTWDYLWNIKCVDSGSVQARHCAWINTNATRYGVLRNFPPSYATFTYCGCLHLDTGWFSDDYLALSESNAMDCNNGTRAYGGGLAVIVFGSYVSNALALKAELMALVSLGGGTMELSANTIDSSPAKNTEGNYNSYMKY